MKQREIVHDVIAEYAKTSLNGLAYLMQNTNENLLSVISQSIQQGQSYVTVNLLVRLAAHIIIVEHDANNKPLYEALMQAGISREHIILAYAGETLSEQQISQIYYDLLLSNLQFYARDPINARSYLTSSKIEGGEIFAIVAIWTSQKQHKANADLIVEWRTSSIIIHYDGHSIPLYESLVDAGIPRERIILAYAGETIPESKPTGE